MTGRNTPDGFLPDVPSLDDLMKRISGDGIAMPNGEQSEMFSEARKKRDQLISDYAWLSAQPQGERILDDLLDQTLRRGTYNGDKVKTIEEATLTRIFREGQCNTVVYILKMIHDGRVDKKPAPAKRRR